MKILSIILIALLELVPKGPAFLNQLQKRDSILVADQVEYGFVLDTVHAFTVFKMPEFKDKYQKMYYQTYLDMITEQMITATKRANNLRKNAKERADAVKEAKYCIQCINEKTCIIWIV